MKYLKLFLILILVIIFCFSVNLLWAQTGIGTGAGQGVGTGAGQGIGTIEDGGGIFTNPLKDGIDNLPGLLGLILEIMVQIGTTIVIIAIIYAGFLYTTARGNESQIRKAHTVIKGVLIGSAIILGAFVIAEVIKNTADDLIEGVMIEQSIV
ncbi:MAG: hypothetical protein WCX70_02650 [Candidatus Paceibacterota bacterium]|jgi:hypothetical protein